MADNTIINPGSGGDTIATDDIGGVKWQRVKIGHGADGSATDVSSASPLPVDTELPAAAALSDSTANPTAPMVGAAGMFWDYATSKWVRMAGGQNNAAAEGQPLVVNEALLRSSNSWYPKRSAQWLGDGEDGTSFPGGANMNYNGSSFDRQRGNTEGTLLASAARTAVATSANQTNYNAKGVIVTLRVTSVGTGNLSVQIVGVVGGVGACILAPYVQMLTAAQGAGSYSYEMYPGSTGSLTAYVYGLQARVSGSLPRTWYYQVAPSDGSSWTYEAYYSYIL